jgi:hypothetical protein
MYNDIWEYMLDKGDKYGKRKNLFNWRRKRHFEEI